MGTVKLNPVKACLLPCNCWCLYYYRFLLLSFLSGRRMPSLTAEELWGQDFLGNVCLPPSMHYLNILLLYLCPLSNSPVRLDETVIINSWLASSPHGWIQE